MPTTTAGRDLASLLPDPAVMRPRLWTLVVDAQPRGDRRVCALVRVYHCEESHLANITREVCALLGVEYVLEQDAARMVGYVACVLPAILVMSLARALYGDALAIAFAPL